MYPRPNTLRPLLSSPSAFASSGEVKQNSGSRLNFSTYRAFASISLEVTVFFLSGSYQPRKISLPSYLDDVIVIVA
jgi:hypothetical protein